MRGLAQEGFLIVEDDFASSAGWAVAVAAAGFFDAFCMCQHIWCVVAKDSGSTVGACKGNEPVDWHDVCFRFSHELFGGFCFGVGAYSVEPFLRNFLGTFIGHWCVDEGIGLFGDECLELFFHGNAPFFC